MLCSIVNYSPMHLTPVIDFSGLIACSTNYVREGGILGKAATEIQGGAGQGQRSHKVEHEGVG